MHDDASPILDFYPTDFKVDLNGKRFAWMGVALLPFIDERRLLTALEDVYSDLTDEEKARNALGADYLMVGRHHPAFNALQILYELPPNSKPVTLNPSQTQGMSGQVSRDPHGIPPGQYVLYVPPAKVKSHDNAAV
jgi:5'-3' exoribonuclease 2